MLGAWLQDIESLEAISQDEHARTLFLRMAAMQREGRTSSFLVELEHDTEVDEETKGSLIEIAQDSDFLLALEEYLRCTRRVH
jgi:hypothetical protein